MEGATVTESLEVHFSRFRENIIGLDHSFVGSDGEEKKVVYADWIASGRLYRPIEKKLSDEIGVYVSNPHSYTSHTGRQITKAYKDARQIIRKHVNASEDDVLVTVGAGMTAAMMRLQEMLDIKNKDKKFEKKTDRPVVFVTHMEHHSNQVSWQETCAEVVILPPGENNLVDPGQLRSALEKYADRKIKIGAFTACSNVNGITTPYHKLAEIMHDHDGYCFVDFAASAPYVPIDMHPKNPKQKLDAIAFSPHKFLGGPGACGILVFDKDIHCGKPCVPGGGNVKWTDPWGQFGYTSDIEAMEDGGTPGFMQTIRTAMAIRLKEKMNPEKMKARELELLERAFAVLAQVPGVQIIGGSELNVSRIGVVAFNFAHLHYNLVVRLLNDYYGIQARGGWSCASTYCHYLFGMDLSDSRKLTSSISSGNMTGKPGWVRISLHPTMTDSELEFVLKAVEEIGRRGEELGKGYYYDASSNEYLPVKENADKPTVAKDFFDIG